MGPRHRAAIIRGHRPALASQPGIQFRRISSAIALGVVVAASRNRRSGVVHDRDGLGVRGHVAGAVLRKPRAVDLISTGAVHIIRRRLGGRDGDRRRIAVLTIVRCSHRRGSRQTVHTAHLDVARGVVEGRRFRVRAGHLLLHLQNVPTRGVIGGIDQGHRGFAISTGIVDFFGASQVEEKVTRSAHDGLTVEGSRVAEPSACTIIAVAVVGHLSHLETEGGHVSQLQGGALKGTLANGKAQP